MDEQRDKLKMSMEQMAASPVVQQVRESNDLFHLTIADSSGNAFPCAMIIALNSLLSELVKHKPDECETFDLKQLGHGEFYGALARRDPDGAARAMRHHIRTMGEHPQKMQAEREGQQKTAGIDAVVSRHMPAVD